MTATGWSDPAMEALAALIARRTGLAFPEARRQDCESRVRAAMIRTGHKDIDSYLLLLATRQDALADLVQDLVVGETYFFRDTACIDLLRDQIFPALTQGRIENRDLRIWSAGCASGEEAYTIAILLDEIGMGERSRIIATDISERAAEQARAARYTQWSLRGMPEATVERCFDKRDGRWELKRHFRRNVRVLFHNLAADAYPSISHGLYGLDLILCRNVLMYLAPDTISAVATRFYECLAEGGWLMTSATDPILADYAAFEALTTPAGIVYRKPPAPPLRMAPVSDAAHGAAKAEAEPPSALPPAAPAPQRVMPPEGALRDGGLLGRAREALVAGSYALAIKLARAMPEQPEAWAVMSRAAANMTGPSEALMIVREGLAVHPLDPELRFLHALFLIDQGREESAIEELRRVIYLDPSLAIAHYVLGAQLRRVGDIAGASRAFNAAYAICEPLPHVASLPMSDGVQAGDLRELAAAEIASIRTVSGARVG